MSAVVVAPLLVALVTAVLTLLSRPSDLLARALSLLGGVAYLVAAGALFARVVLPLGSTPRRLVYEVSNWQAPFGIVLVADALSAFMLGLSAVVVLPALVYAVVYVDEFGQRLSFHPLFHLMVVGITGAFLTGDVFNLFVWFEVMLMASYVLVAFYSGPQHTRAALRYAVLNLVGSAVMLVAIGGLYATVGTLNMADMARRLADPGAYGVSLLPVLGLSAALFAVFALKAGVVPFQFWVPAAYRAAPAPVTAVLAGVVKKVGIYAVVRLYFTVFAAAALPVSLPGIGGDSPLAFFGPVLFAMAAGSALLGGVAAVGADDLETLLSYSSVAQVGFIVLPLAVAATVPEARALGVAAALVYSFNHGLAKAALFLVAGTVQSAAGSVAFADLGGLAPRAPVLAGTFLLAALSLVGVPPLVGFFGKLLVFRTAARGAGVGGAGAALAVGVALAGAVLTIAYVSRSWNAAFWGVPTERVRRRLPARWRRPGADPDAGGTYADGGAEGVASLVRGAGGGRAALAVQVTAAVTLALAALGFGVGFEAVVASAEAAAEAALDTGGYVEAVDPAAPGPRGGEGA